MNLQTSVATTHRIKLAESERFDVTTKTGRPITVRVDFVQAQQASQGDRWDIFMLGHRVLKSGELGKVQKVDSWEYLHSFRHDVDKELFELLPLAVRVELQSQGVSF